LTFVDAHITTGEVAALEHELGDDTVERRALVAEAILASAELAEVAGRLRHHVIVEGEIDAARLHYSRL
jgi:PIN domain nuclease of toxin-antitoxin system